MARQGGDQVALLPRDGIQRTERFEVGGLDRRDHCDGGRRDLRKPVDLTEVVCRHLQHGDPVFRQQLAERDRQTVESVIVGPVLEDLRSPCENLSDGFLGRGLAHAAGDPDDRHLGSMDEVLRPILHGLPRVVHHDAGRVSSAQIYGRLAKDSGRSSAHRVQRVCMPVSPLGHHRDKQLSRPDDSGVEAE